MELPVLREGNKVVHTRSVETIKFNGKTFNVEPVRSLEIEELPSFREADLRGEYGAGFRQGTYGDQFDLFYALCLAYNTQPELKMMAHKKLKYFIDGSDGVGGNTAIIRGSNLIIVQDMPEIRGGKIIMDEKDLIAKLGSREVNGVLFSDDGHIRATPYGVTTYVDGNFPLMTALTGDTSVNEKLEDLCKMRFAHPISLDRFRNVKKTGMPLTPLMNIHSRYMTVDSTRDPSSEEVVKFNGWTGYRPNSYSFGILENEFRGIPPIVITKPVNTKISINQ